MALTGASPLPKEVNHEDHEAYIVCVSVLKHRFFHHTTASRTPAFSMRELMKDNLDLEKAGVLLAVEKNDA